MKTVEEVELTNMCQYENSVFEFQPGLTAVIGPNGTGKCLAYGTKVLRDDGTAAYVEDLRLGDRLLSCDGTINRITALSQGTTNMFSVRSEHGGRILCTPNHMLTLRVRSGKSIAMGNKIYHAGDLIDITAEALYTFKNELESLLCWARTGRIEFNNGHSDHVDPEIDAYLYGMYYGSGVSEHAFHGFFGVMPYSRDLVAYMHSRYGFPLYEEPSEGSMHLLYDMKGVREFNWEKMLELMKPGTESFSIPESIRLGNPDTRERFLEGFLKIRGRYLGSGCFDARVNRKERDEISFLARSLGFFVSFDCREQDFSIIRIEKPREAKEPLEEGFLIVMHGLDDYIGIEVTGDKRMLLDDLTITHNSNLARSVIYGITGMVDGTWGAQSDLQKDGTVSPGNVKVTFRENDKLYRLTRYVKDNAKHPDTLEVSEDNGDSWTLLTEKRKAVDAVLSVKLGAPVSLLFTVLWGRQGELDFLLRAPAAVIDSFLALMFDTKRLEKLRDCIKAASDRLASFPEDYEAGLKGCIERLEALKSDEELESAVRKAAEDRDACSAEVNRLNAMKSDEAVSAEEKNRLLYEASEAVRAFEIRLAAAMKLVRGAEGIDADQVNSELSAAKEDFSRAADAISEKQSIVMNGKMDFQLKAKTLAELRTERKTLEDLIGNFVSDECILCGSEIQDEEAYRRKYSEVVLRLENGMNAEKRLEEVKSGISTLVEDLRKTKKSISDTLEELKELENEKKQLEGRVDELTGKLGMLSKIEGARNIKLQLDASKAELERINKLKVMDPEFEKEYAAAVMAEKEAHEAYEAAIREESAVKTERLSLIDTKQFYSEMNEKAAINKQALFNLTEVRAAMSQKRAQARYLRMKIAEINRRLSRFLDMSGMPFTVFLDDVSHTFCYSMNGVCKPAARLSGAQKNIAAVALQLALVEMLSHDLNFFIMDEPTEALDDSNKRIMSSMFETLTEMLSQETGTMLLITRDEAVIENCSQIIQLETKNKEEEEDE